MLEYQNICVGCMGDKGQADLCPHCGYIEGTPPPNAQYLSARTLLAGKYLIGRGLGHGGFGVTYLAYDTVLKRKLAIKEYLPQDCATRAAGESEVTPFSGEEKQEQFYYGVDKFLEEARTLAQFDGHPNIVGVRDFFKDNGTAYLVMNFLSGETLKDYLRRHDRALGYQQALKIMLPVMDALRTVHAAGVLHRDVSPDNIFLTGGGQVKLIDFGAARQPRSGQRSISVILKPGYAPEEQYRSRGKQGPWTDVYATAATFYRAITGKVPPESLDRMEQDTLVPPSQLGVRIPPEAERALLTAMAVRASDRYQTIQAFKDAVNPSVEATAPAAAPPPRAKIVQEPRIDLPVQHPQQRQVTQRQQQPPPRPARQVRDDPSTYPLRYRKRGGVKVGIVVAALIILIVLAGVLALLYWLGSAAERLGSQTPPPATTYSASQQPGSLVSPGITTFEALPTPNVSQEPATETPSPTPIPANMIAGAKPSLPVGRYMPESGLIISWKEKNAEHSRLTSNLGSTYIYEREMNGNVQSDDIYMYFTDDQSNIRYAKLGDGSEGTVYLPADCAVGSQWSVLSARYTVVAVDYTATLRGVQYTNCIVAQDGNGQYRFYVPGLGLHTIRPEIDVDEGESYFVFEYKGTNIIWDVDAVG